MKTIGREWRIWEILEADKKKDDLPERWPVNLLTFVQFYSDGKREEGQIRKSPLGWINWCHLTHGVQELGCTYSQGPLELHPMLP